MATLERSTAAVNYLCENELLAVGSTVKPSVFVANYGKLLRDTLLNFAPGRRDGAAPTRAALPAILTEPERSDKLRN